MDWNDDAEEEVIAPLPSQSKGMYITESDPRIMKGGKNALTGLGLWGTLLGSIFLGIGILYIINYINHPSDYCIVASFVGGAIVFYFFGAVGWTFSSSPKLVVYENGLALAYSRLREDYYSWEDMEGFRWKRDNLFGKDMNNIKVVMGGEEAITIHERVPKFDEVVELVALKLPELDAQESQ